jgi:hypothetical protein
VTPRVLTAALLALALAGHARAATFLIDEGSAGYSETGGWATYSSSDFFIGHNLRYTQDAAAAVATYNPAAIGFTPGAYNLYIQWDVYTAGPPSTSDALYTINHAGGTTTLHIDQTKLAYQNAVTGAPAANPSGPVGGGYYFLGNYTLNNLSSVSVQKSAPNEPSTYLTADALYATNDGFLVQPLTDKATYTGYSGTSIYYYPGPAGAALTEATAYPYSFVDGATATYTPGVAGMREVKVSWSAADHHSTDIGWVVDLDGNPLTLGDQATFTIDSTKVAANQLAGPTAGTTQTWSDYYSLGNHLLTAASTITATNHTSLAIATDVVFISNPVLVPEPASAALLAAGAALVLKRRRGV